MISVPLPSSAIQAQQTMQAPLNLLDLLDKNICFASPQMTSVHTQIFYKLSLAFLKLFSCFFMLEEMIWSSRWRAVVVSGEIATQQSYMGNGISICITNLSAMTRVPVTFSNSVGKVCNKVKIFINITPKLSLIFVNLD